MSASAAFPGQPYETQFEIDGNIAVDGAQDWASTPASAPNLQGAPFEDTEVCDKNPAVVNGEVVTDDPTRVVPGTKIDDILIASPPIGGSNVPKKTDLCSVYSAWELVFVPTADPGDDPDAGQYNFILYGAWSRPDVNGEIDVLFPLLGSNPSSNDDDRVISYDFNDSTNVTTVDVLKWNGSSWVSTNISSSSFNATTTSGEVLHAVTGASLTFGEFALNLTASGILPEDGPCTTFSTGDPISRTGNSTSATLEDIVDATPLALTNCGSLTITKLTRPVAPDPAQSFGVHTAELDGRVIQSPGTTSLNTTLTVPGTPSVTYNNLLISPDYAVNETNVPAGWTQESLVCTSYDPIVGHNVTRTLYSNGDNGPDASFPVAPGVNALCTVTNVGPPTVSVTKTVVGPTSDWSFDFTISPVPTGQDATKHATDEDPTVSWQLEAGVEYTITEEPADGYIITDDVSCGEGGNTFTPEAGDEIVCGVTNTELIPLAVSATAAASFDRTVTWSLDKSVDPATQSGTAGADAGTSTWTVTATKHESLGNFGVTGTVTIVNANGFDVPFTITDSLDDSSGVTLNCPSQTVLADDELVCTFSAAPSDASATEFDATVTPDELLDPQSTTASVDFVENLIGDDTVVVDDDRDTDGQFPAEISDSQTFTYDETFPCSANRADYTNLLDTDTYVNTATLTGENTDLSDAADVTVTCEIGEIEQQAPPIADIAVTKTATPTVVNPGGNTTWTLVARNNGPDAADNAAIVDNLPSTLTLVSFTSPAGWDCSGTITGNPGKLSCTKPSMAVNESATFTLTTTVNAAAGTTINNTAVVSTSTGETTTANNQDSEPITVAVAVLPPTGAGHVWDRLAIAAGLVLAGGLLLAVDRRRRIIS